VAEAISQSDSFILPVLKDSHMYCGSLT